ncbi:hypothetical protein MJT46_018864 [Ovis ammon polii x Ovis aries]|nr:hypothetical protein MJT46_018864 [Ovis ammon polii x Ovis aries]
MTNHYNLFGVSYRTLNIVIRFGDYNQITRVSIMKSGFRSPAVPALTRAETSPSTHGQSAPRIGSFGCRLPPGEVTYSKAVKLVCCEIEFQLDAKLISFRSSNFDQDTVTVCLNADKLQSLNENSDFQSFHPRKTFPESTTVFKWLLDYKDTTTYSTERSEHFKPCRDKDLAYCLNDGECFVIETLTGSHKHCRRIILIAGERTDGRNS